MPLALLLIFCLASGFALVSLGFPGTVPSSGGLLLRSFLSFGYGVGSFSVTFVFARVLGWSRWLTIDLLVFALLMARYLMRRHTPAVEFLHSSDGAEFFPRFQRFLISALVAAFAIALYCAALRVVAFPHGEGWDAFAIWNLHARFLLRGSAHWRDGFSPLIAWSHPDYPLLIPAAIAHFWSYLGYEDRNVPGVIGLLFTFSTVGLLYSSLRILRGRTVAKLGSLVLLTTPSFIETGTTQYADVPLAFFFLAAIALLCLYDTGFRTGGVSPKGLLVLAGLGSGFAAWTKNEGLLFLFAMLVGRAVVLIRPRHDPAVPSVQLAAESWRSFGMLLLSVAPSLILIGWFKHSVPPGDIFVDSTAALHKVLDPTRYWVICKWYTKEFFRFGHWVLVPGTVLLAGLYVAASRKMHAPSPPGFRSSVITLAITLAGYTAIYLITPHDIYWHLTFSLTRLFLHLWPSTIFLFFLRLRLEVLPAPPSISADSDAPTSYPHYMQ
jgi:hypothetical protein